MSRDSILLRRSVFAVELDSALRVLIRPCALSISLCKQSQINMPGCPTETSAFKRRPSNALFYSYHLSEEQNRRKAEGWLCIQTTESYISYSSGKHCRLLNLNVQQGSSDSKVYPINNDPGPILTNQNPAVGLSNSSNLLSSNSTQIPWSQNPKPRISLWLLGSCLASTRSSMRHIIS